MKIKFVNEFSEDVCSVPFAFYQHDESLLRNAHCIDIRAIVRQRHLFWLDELQASHAQVAQRFLKHTRWWWATPMSRLDARPWGQEYVLKPLFFAKAVHCWLEDHAEAEEITLVGCPSSLAYYLKELNKDFDINRVILFLAKLKTVYTVIKNSIWAFLKLIIEFFSFCWKHVFKKASFGSGKTLVLYELTRGGSIHSGHEYYFANIFDSFDKETLSFSCLSKRKGHCSCKGRKKKESTGSSAFYLFDHVGMIDALTCFLRNVHIIFCAWSFIFIKQPCRIGENASSAFWTNFLFCELKRLSCFEALCSYPALKKVLHYHPYDSVVYPYEEKGVERSILLACQERKAKTIGYTAHPQHRLTVALRDITEFGSPKPSNYAVCGEAYVDYFRSWAGKKNAPISVWGSGKDFKKCFNLSDFSQDSTKVLVLVSHPNELRVFSSWLRSEERMSKDVEYSLRLYKTLNCKEMMVEAKSLIDQFSCVRESNGDLVEDLSGCDIAVFCATSAGIVAAKHGVLVSQIQIDDFFPINPCFDRLVDMLSCASSNEFADHLQGIRLMNKETRQEIYDRQQIFAEEIFSSEQKETIRKDVSC